MARLRSKLAGGVAAPAEKKTRRPAAAAGGVRAVGERGSLADAIGVRGQAGKVGVSAAQEAAARRYLKDSSGYQARTGRSAGVLGAKLARGKAVRVNENTASGRAGQAFQEFERDGEKFHVYFQGGKRIALRVAKPKKASGAGGVAAPS